MKKLKNMFAFLKDRLLLNLHKEAAGFTDLCYQASPTFGFVEVKELDYLQSQKNWKTAYFRFWRI